MFDDIDLGLSGFGDSLLDGSSLLGGMAVGSPYPEQRPLSPSNDYDHRQFLVLLHALVMS